MQEDIAAKSIRLDGSVSIGKLIETEIMERFMFEPVDEVTLETIRRMSVELVNQYVAQTLNVRFFHDTQSIVVHIPGIEIKS